MTVIAYRDGILAADSQTTTETEAGGIRKFGCEKLFHFKSTARHEHECIIATAGENAPGLIFLDWYARAPPKRKPPSQLVDGDADFTCLVLTKAGLFEYDKYCRGEQIKEQFYAIGCGAKAALGAMHRGASAAEACEITCLIDPLCALPIVTMQLQK
jgi:hypothetical protein